MSVTCEWSECADPAPVDLSKAEVVEISGERFVVHAACAENAVEHHGATRIPCYAVEGTPILSKSGWTLLKGGAK